MIPNCKKEIQNNDHKIFYWDGKSSTTNASNLNLWKSIVNCAKDNTVFVISESYTTSTVFILKPSFEISSTKTLLASYGTCVKVSTPSLRYY